MNGNAEIETEREVLKRIVAMLFSFACLAERVAGRSYPIRCLVLWVLRRAEAVARDWVTDSAEDLQSNSPLTILHRNSRAEALHLAQSFRALAHTLKRELRLEERPARRLRRGKASRAITGMPQRDLLKSEPLCQLARTASIAMRNLRDIACQAAARLDTS